MVEREDSLRSCSVQQEVEQALMVRGHGECGAVGILAEEERVLSLEGWAGPSETRRTDERTGQRNSEEVREFQ